MPVFPTKEWCEAAIAAANADPDSARAGQGWVGDLAAVVLAEPPALEEAVALYVEPVDGRFTNFRMLDDVDEIDELEPAYVAKAPYSVWKGLILGTLDPIEAVLMRKIELQGDVQQVIERAKYKDLAHRILSKVETIFPDEG
ncbi:MAG: SCP2 sterol-binding domain-containing protein [Myxococcales bacterium]